MTNLYILDIDGDSRKQFDTKNGAIHGYWKDMLNILAFTANDKLSITDKSKGGSTVRAMATCIYIRYAQLRWVFPQNMPGGRLENTDTRRSDFSFNTHFLNPRTCVFDQAPLSLTIPLRRPPQLLVVVFPVSLSGQHKQALSTKRGSSTASPHHRPYRSPPNNKSIYYDTALTNITS